MSPEIIDTSVIIAFIGKVRSLDVYNEQEKDKIDVTTKLLYMAIAYWWVCGAKSKNESYLGMLCLICNADTWGCYNGVSGVMLLTNTVRPPITSVPETEHVGSNGVQRMSLSFQNSLTDTSFSTRKTQKLFGNRWIRTDNAVKNRLSILLKE
ncbi:hypothetical protein Tco_1326753 [Tanacetum coccineum]